MNHAPHRHLPRLGPEAYRGLCFVHWTMTIADRRRGWLTSRFHDAFRTIYHKYAISHGVVVPAYCLMPDHLHVLAAGIRGDSDQSLWGRVTRRALNETLKPIRLQKQAFDHLLRAQESGPDAFAALAHYIAENPVRAGLVSAAHEWYFSGSIIPDFPEIDPRNQNFREKWWRYWMAKATHP